MLLRRRPRSLRLPARNILLVLWVVVFAGLGCAPGSPPGPEPSAHIARLEPRLVDGALVVRFEIENDGAVPVALIDGLVAARREPDVASFDPRLDVSLASDEPATLVVRKGDLTFGWERWLLPAELPVLKTIEPGERFSDVVRIRAPNVPFERVRLVIDVVANLRLAEAPSAEGPVLSAPLASVAAARWRLTSEATPLLSDEPIGLGGEEADAPE